MKLSVPLFTQHDPRWGNTKLGTSSYTIGTDGCTITSMAMLVKYYGKDTDPQRLDAMTTNVGGFSGGSAYIWGSLTTIYPDIAFTQIKEYPNDPAPVDALRKELDLGHPIPVWLDSNPRQAGNQMHWVLLVGYEGNDFWINDPWTGDQVLFTSRYGDPVKAILGHRFYAGPVPQAPSDFQTQLNELRKARDDNWNLYQGALSQLKKAQDKAGKYDSLRKELSDLLSRFS